MLNINNQKLYLGELKSMLYEKITKFEGECKLLLKDENETENSDPNLSSVIDNLTKIESQIDNFQSYNTLKVTNIDVNYKII
jgi:hypothetical protein